MYSIEEFLKDFLEHEFKNENPNISIRSAPGAKALSLYSSHYPTPLEDDKPEAKIQRLNKLIGLVVVPKLDVEPDTTFELNIYEVKKGYCSDLPTLGETEVKFIGKFNDQFAMRDFVKEKFPEKGNILCIVSRDSANGNLMTAFMMEKRNSAIGSSSSQSRSGFHPSSVFRGRSCGRSFI